MSCGCDILPVCVGGKSYFASIQYNPRGDFLSGSYLDENLQRIPLTAGSFAFGSCDAIKTDVARITAALVAGNNVITHNLNKSEVEVEVRNAATGADVAVRVIAETLNTVTIFVPVATPIYRISIDA
jgi:hypothetical protein